jgi:integrase
MQRKVVVNQPFWTAKAGNVNVPVYRREQVKKGRSYVNFTIIEHREGKRLFHTLADLTSAKAKAQGLADAIEAGTRKTYWFQDEAYGIAQAIKLALDAGFDDLGAACRVLRDASALVGPNQIVLAAQAFAASSKGQFTPTLVSQAVTDFLERRKSKVVNKRLRCEAAHLKRIVRAFGTRHIHEISPVDLSDMLDKSGLAPSTRNGALKMFSLFFDDCVSRRFSTVNPASSRAIKRTRMSGGEIGIFTPSECKSILSGIDDDLKAFVALWMFSGIRKEEISKLSWQEIQTGLASGKIYLEAVKTKTGTARSVPIAPNLKKWLEAYKRPSGPVFPVGQDLDMITKAIAAQSGVAWKDNGPRHSFATYSLATGKAPAEVAREMGNSLQKLDSHYWAKGQSIDKSTGEAWFAISPDDCAAKTEKPSVTRSAKLKATANSVLVEA